MRFLGRLLGRYSMEDIADAKARGDIDLITRAARSRDMSIRFAVIDALGQLSPHEATPVLISALYDDEPNVRSAAERALRSHHWNPKDDAEKIAGLIAASDYATLSNLSADELIGSASTDCPRWARSYPLTWSLAVLTALKHAPAATGDRLLEMLTSSNKDPSIRAMAAQALAVRKDDRAVEPLLALYSSGPEECFDSVATALQLFSQQDAMAQQIIDVMLTALHGRHAGSAGRILAYIGARAVASLRKLTEDQSAISMVRGLAAYALAGTGAPGSLHTLSNLEPGLLLGAILQKTKDSPFLSVPYITLYTWSDSVPECRIVAMLALGNLSHLEDVSSQDVSFLERVARWDGHDAVRHEAVFALGKMTRNLDARKALLNAVNDASWPSGERLASLLVLLWHDVPLLGPQFNFSDASF